MKNNYLLDTNICIALLRGNQDVAQKLIDLGEGRCCLSVITLYELMLVPITQNMKSKKCQRLNYLSNVSRLFH